MTKVSPDDPRFEVDGDVFTIVTITDNDAGKGLHTPLWGTHTEPAKSTGSIRLGIGYHYKQLNKNQRLESKGWGKGSLPCVRSTLCSGHTYTA